MAHKLTQMVDAGVFSLQLSAEARAALTADPDLDEALASRVKQFKAVLRSAIQMFADKGIVYGDTTPETGVLGAVVELIGNTARLKRLVLRSPDLGLDEYAAVEDTLLDILIYAAIGLIHLDLDNWKGK